jgi:predicted nucleic acid-binding protein
MIVVDTNVIAYLLLTGKLTPKAKASLYQDPDWIAPILWRSEFRNVLAIYLRKNHLSFNQALELMHEAEILMKGGEYEIPSSLVLDLADNSKCSAYDCEFIALARELGVLLLTSDKLILSEFPDIAISLDDFIS